MGKHLSINKPFTWNKMLVTLATYPDVKQAHAILLEEGFDPTLKSLEVLKRNKAEELEKIRTELGPALEEATINDMRDVGWLAAQSQKIALERAIAHLQATPYMSSEVAVKVAREASQVATQNADKRLALEGRPNVIKEDRSWDEAVRGLEALKVAKWLNAPVVDSTAEEE